MSALDELVIWLRSYVFLDRKKKLPPGLVLQYHGRSDAHSKFLGRAIVDDLLDACPPLREQAASGKVAFRVNYPFTWPNGKTKTLDLAIGLLVQPMLPLPLGQIHQAHPKRQPLSRLFFACEEKSTMTEHGKSQPRIYSELNDAHTIVHQGARDTIATGITMLNIAKSFISALRQAPDREIVYSTHDQPSVTANMVAHLRKLPIRDRSEEVGLDAYCTFVIDLNNQGHVDLWTAPPAPQPGESDEYQTFIERVSAIYAERYGNLDDLPEPASLTIEDMLIEIAGQYPGLLTSSGESLLASGVAGSEELAAILTALEARVNPAPDGEEDNN